MLNDFRYALRMLAKRPEGTFVVLGTLSLLVGAMTFLTGMYVHEESAYVPFQQRERLVRLWRVGDARPQPIFAARLYADLRKDLKSTDLVAAFQSYQPFAVTGRGEPLSASGAIVSASLFDLMGIQPLLGRTFRPADEHAGSRLVILTRHLWETRFNSDDSVIGTSITLNDAPHTLIGVMPESADRNLLFYGIDLWIPGDFESPARGESAVDIVARLKQDSSLSQLRAELDVAVPQLEQTLPQGWKKFGSDKARTSAFPIREDFSQWKAEEIVLIGLITAVPLLIACTNLANILLGRIESRRREFAVRFSIGAGRSRVMRQVLIESISLALLSVPGGVILSRWAAHFSARHGAPVEFDFALLAWVVLFAVILGCAIGALPAWRATRADLAGELKDGGGSASGGVERHRLRQLLTAAQMAMATVLCITAALLFRSYLNRQRFDPGFDVSQLVDVVVSPRRDAYDTAPKRSLFRDQALDRLAAVPGVSAVGVASSSLIDLTTLFRTSFQTRGDGGSYVPSHITHIEVISPSMQQMANIHVLRGRPLSDADHSGADPVMLVSKSFVDSFLGNSDPIGQQIGMNVDGPLQWITIVGVVPDQRNLGLRETVGPEVYLCHHQFAPSWMQYNFFAQTLANPAQLAPSLRQAVQSVDSAQPVSQAFLLKAQLEGAATRNIDAVQTVWAIAAFGLVMALLGIYGVVSRAVVERTHEVGVRMALGARGGDILQLILRQAMQPVSIGVLIGVGLAAGASQALRQLLFGIGGIDAVTYAALAMLLVLTALLAAIFPAMRAMRVDPMTALRSE